MPTFKEYTGIRVVTDPEFGATGGGVIDDTAAIQAAVDDVVTAGRGIVHFPAGTYKISSPGINPNFNGELSIKFTGVGSLSTLTGDFAGFIIDRDLTPTFNPGGGIKVIEGLRIINSHSVTGGGIRMGSSIGVCIQNCGISADQGIHFIQSDPEAGSQSSTVLNCTIGNGSGVVTTGQNGIVMAGNGAIIGCDQSGHDVGYRLYGVGFNVIGGRMEGNNTAIKLAQNTAGVASGTGCSGFTIQGTSFEANSTAIHFANGAGFFNISGLNILGNIGAAPGGTDSQYGIRSEDTASMGIFAGIKIAGNYAVTGFKVGDSGTAGLVIVGVQCASGTGPAWTLPAFANTAQIIGCNNPALTFPFANLPASPVEGMAFDLNDANIGGKVIGDSITAGGSTGHIRVRYNGSAWKWASN